MFVPLVGMEGTAAGRPAGGFQGWSAEPQRLPAPQALSTSSTLAVVRITQGGGAWPGYRRVWLVDDPVSFGTATKFRRANGSGTKIRRQCRTTQGYSRNSEKFLSALLPAPRAPRACHRRHKNSGRIAFDDGEVHLPRRCPPPRPSARSHQILGCQPADVRAIDLHRARGGQHVGHKGTSPKPMIASRPGTAICRARASVCHPTAQQVRAAEHGISLGTFVHQAGQGITPAAQRALRPTLTTCTGASPPARRPPAKAAGAPRSPLSSSAVTRR